MSGIEIAIFCTLAVTTVSSLLVVLRKHIKRSKCCGGEVEFRTNSVPQPVDVIITPSPLAEFPVTPRGINV
jgi:hypothetical protein